MLPPPPISTLPHTCFPVTTLFRPFRADVTAEIYRDLSLTVAAILGSALARTGVAPPRKVDTLLGEVTGDMLRQYNEEKGPFALAMKLARKIRTERDPLLGQQIGRASCRERVCQYV